MEKGYKSSGEESEGHDVEELKELLKDEGFMAGIKKEVSTGHQIPSIVIHPPSSELKKASLSATDAKESLGSDGKLSVVLSELNEEDFEDYIPEPPDGGWGWVVMIASFFNNFILDGIAYCFGVFLTEYTEAFGSSKSSTSLASALLCGVYLLFGPFAGALVNKFGCRPVGIAGSLIGAVAFILSSFANSVEVFHLTYGFLGGIGFGMMYLPAVVGVGYYFEKKRAIATGIAVCGTGIGTFCLAPVGKILLQNFDWRSSQIILAGLILQGCISSALMRPLTPKKKKKSAESPKTDPGIVEKAKDAILNKRAKPKHAVPPDQKYDNKKNQNISKSSHLIGRQHTQVSKHSNSLTTQRLHASAFLTETGIRDTNSIIKDLKRPLYKKDIFYSGSVYNLGSKSHASNPYISSQVSVAAVSVYEDDYHQLSCLRHLPKPMADILAEMLDLHVLKHKGMMILSIANIVGMLGFYVPIIFAADRAKGLGIDDTNAALLISIMGACNTAGRVIAGCLSFAPKISPLLVNNICITLAGVAVILTPFCTSFVSMAIAIAGYGFFCSTLISLSSIIICDLVGLEKLTNGFGLICLVRGITAIAGPPLEGWLYDATGDYDATFYMGGACLILSGILHFLLHLSCFRTEKFG